MAGGIRKSAQEANPATGQRRLVVSGVATLFLAVMGQVESAQYLEEYTLRLTFSNQVTGDVDLSEELYGKIFEPLRDVQVFKQVFLNPETRTIEWPNGAGFALGFLYDLGLPVPQIA